MKHRDLVVATGVVTSRARYRCTYFHEGVRRDSSEAELEHSAELRPLRGANRAVSISVQDTKQQRLKLCELRTMHAEGGRACINHSVRLRQLNLRLEENVYE